MITFIAFLITIAGCTNWMMIGLLQYDFIAGLFGYQGSMFSRLVYILFGLGAAYLIIRVIANKGTFKIYEKKNKKKKETAQQSPQQAVVNVEAADEQSLKPKPKKWWQFWKKKPKKQKPAPSQNIAQEATFTSTPQTEEPQQSPQQNSQNSSTLFDEHFK